jgi:2-methylcitrate dehydratase PrpD
MTHHRMNKRHDAATRRAAQTAVAMGQLEPDADTKRKVALVLLDFIGCCLEVVHSPVGAATQTYGAAHWSAPEAHQWGLKQKVSAEDAALANGILGHGLIREDMHVPGCNFVQTAAAAALQLHAQLGAQGTRAIRRIVISTFSAARNYPGCDSVGPFSRLEQSKMSFQYAICAALRHGRLDNTIYSYYDDAELQRLIGLTELRIDPVFEQRILPAQPARVEVEMAHGERLASELADVPWFDAEAVRGRFLATAQPALGDEDTRRLVKLVDTLWNQDDTSEFFSLMQKTG